jgi:Fe-S-cluster containining protein
VSTEDPSARAEFNLRLRVGDAEADEVLAKVRVPTGPVRPVDLLPAFQGLADALVDAAIEAVRREGKPVSCRAGCGACCRQLVPISHTEALGLAAVVAGLSDDRRRQIVERFRGATAAIRARGLLDRLQAAPRQTDPDETGRLARDYFKAQVACPFLEDESCSIYPHRPLSCREYLVTTPAIHCQTPDSSVIAKVPLYAKPTRILFCFDDGRGRGELCWLPLALALEWAVAPGTDRR